MKNVHNFTQIGTYFTQIYKFYTIYIFYTNSLKFNIDLFKFTQKFTIQIILYNLKFYTIYTYFKQFYAILHNLVRIYTNLPIFYTNFTQIYKLHTIWKTCCFHTFTQIINIFIQFYTISKFSHFTQILNNSSKFCTIYKFPTNLHTFHRSLSNFEILQNSCTNL